MKIKYLTASVFALLVLAACKSFQNGGGEDWATAEFNVGQSRRNNPRYEAITGSAETVLVLAVPGSVSSITVSDYLTAYFDGRLQDLNSDTVTLTVPLNIRFRLLQIVYSEIFSLGYLLGNEPEASSCGMSDLLELTADDAGKTVPVAMNSCDKIPPEVASTVPIDGATGVAIDSTVSITFNEEMDISTISANTADTSCSGSLQLSSDNFSSCVQMSAAPAAGNGNMTVSLSPAADLENDTSYQLKATTAISDISGNGLAVEFTSSFTTIPYSALGILDTDFASIGYSVHDTVGGSAGDDTSYAVALDANGKLLVVGKGVGTNYDMVILRFNTDGSLDNTFDSDGIVVADVAGLNDEGQAITIDSSGKILVAGAGWGANYDMAVWRFNSDGSPDNTFDTDGINTDDNAAGGASSTDLGKGITVDGSGKILVTGTSVGTTNDMVIWRYNSDGSLDTSFGTGGIAVHDNAAGGAAGYDSGSEILVDSNDRIVVAGGSNNGSDNDMVIWRFNSDGSLDTSFGTGGVAVHDKAAGGNGTDNVQDMVIDSEGNILVSGNSHNGTNADMVVWRYTSDGSLDTSFGTNGIVVYDNAANGNGNDTGAGIALDLTGKILVTGYSSNGTDNDLAIWRLNDDGSLDTAFGADGIVIHHDAAGGDAADLPYGITVDASGRILVAGQSDNGTDEDIVVWRFK